MTITPEIVSLTDRRYMAYTAANRESETLFVTETQEVLGITRY